MRVGEADDLRPDGVEDRRDGVAGEDGEEGLDGETGEGGGGEGGEVEGEGGDEEEDGEGDFLGEEAGVGAELEGVVGVAALEEVVDEARLEELEGAFRGSGAEDGFGFQVRHGGFLRA